MADNRMEQGLHMTRPRACVGVKCTVPRRTEALEDSVVLEHALCWCIGSTSKSHGEGEYLHRHACCMFCRHAMGCGTQRQTDPAHLLGTAAARCMGTRGALRTPAAHPSTTLQAALTWNEPILLKATACKLLVQQSEHSQCCLPHRHLNSIVTKHEANTEPVLAQAMMDMLPGYDLMHRP